MNSDHDGFERWRLGETNGAPPEEVLAEAGRLLDLAQLNEEPAWVELEGGFVLGWHPETERFRIAGRQDGAPGHLPAWLAALETARHVHAGGQTPELAYDALIRLLRQAANQV